MIAHSTKAESIARRLVAKLKDIIPRQMVQINIQVAVNSRILARETLKAFKKDVTAKLVSVTIFFLYFRYVHFILVWRRCYQEKEIISPAEGRQAEDEVCSQH